MTGKSGRYLRESIWSSPGIKTSSNSFVEQVRLKLTCRLDRPHHQKTVLYTINHGQLLMAFKFFLFHCYQQSDTIYFYTSLLRPQLISSFSHHKQTKVLNVLSMLLFQIETVHLYALMFLSILIHNVCSLLKRQLTEAGSWWILALLPFLFQLSLQ